MQSSQNDPSIYRDWKNLQTVTCQNYTIESGGKYRYYYTTYKKANAKYLFFVPLAPQHNFNGDDELHLYMTIQNQLMLFI